MILDNMSPPFAQRKHRAFAEDNHEQQGLRAGSSPFSPPSSAKVFQILDLASSCGGPRSGNDTFAYEEPDPLGERMRCIWLRDARRFRECDIRNPLFRHS